MPVHVTIDMDDDEYRRRLNEVLAMSNDRRHLIASQRYYCPTCGEVAFGYNDGRGWRVDRHSKWIEEWRYGTCPGGIIDNTKDKAP